MNDVPFDREYKTSYSKASPSFPPKRALSPFRNVQWKQWVSWWVLVIQDSTIKMWFDCLDCTCIGTYREKVVMLRLGIAHSAASSKESRSNSVACLVGWKWLPDGSDQVSGRSLNVFVNSSQHPQSNVWGRMRQAHSFLFLLSVFLSFVFSFKKKTLFSVPSLELFASSYQTLQVLVVIDQVKSRFISYCSGIS